MFFTALTFVYLIVTLWLTIYALNAWVMTGLFLKNGRKPDPSLPPPTEEANPWPAVTVQLPIFNEALVVERLISAVAGLDYPFDRLQIQVLDDSTDET